MVTYALISGQCVRKDNKKVGVERKLQEISSLHENLNFAKTMGKILVSVWR